MNNLFNVVNNLLQCCAAPCQQYCAAPCQQLLSTTIVHNCSRSTIIVQSFLTIINKLFSSTIVSSCSHNIVTTIVLCQHRTAIDRTILINIKQVLLNLDNHIVQALFSEQRCINLINFCPCIASCMVNLHCTIRVQ